MFNNYSGTYFGVLIATIVPLFIQAGLSEDCANETVKIAVPAVVGLVTLVIRYFKGDVTIAGKYKDLP